MTDYELEEGLAAERTELAWGRSSLSLVVCGLAVARGLPQITTGGPEPVAGAFVLAAGGLAWLAGVPYARARSRAKRSGEHHLATKRELVLLTAGTVLVGLAALLVEIVLVG